MFSSFIVDKWYDKCIIETVVIEVANDMSRFYDRQVYREPKGDFAEGSAHYLIC